MFPTALLLCVRPPVLCCAVPVYTVGSCPTNAAGAVLLSTSSFAASKTSPNNCQQLCAGTTRCVAW